MPRVVVDGNEAVAHISYAFTEVSAIYPITPSSTMAECVEEMSFSGFTNVFGDVVQTVEMQSEAGVAGTMHGLLKTGTLTTTYTCSQGLLLMEPALFKMAGELLPAVLHVSARALSTSALSIFCDHSDVMTVRQLGVIMVCSASVQEAALFAAVAHETALKSRLPIIHFFDGFHTSHEQRKILLPDIEEIETVIDKASFHEFKLDAMRNDRPKASGSNMTPDIYFQQMEANNSYYLSVEGIMSEILDKYNPLFGTTCSLLDYYGSRDAKVLMVSMGSVNDTICQVVDELNQDCNDYASVSLHLYRPFPKTAFLNVLPKHVEGIVVLDRTKENGSVAEPLLADIQSVCYDLDNPPKIIGGRFGLGSKNVTPDQIRASFLEVRKKDGKRRFTIGIVDDVTQLSLEPIGESDLTDKTATFQVKTWGFGSDGAVSCNRQTAKVIGELTNYDVQAQFWFDSNKSDNLTISHLRFSNQIIRSNYYVSSANFVMCYSDRYIRKFPVLEDLQENGMFLLNTTYTKKDIERLLPNHVKKTLAQKNVQFYVIPAKQIARKYDLGPKINTVMQVCFLYLSQLTDFELALDKLKQQIIAKYKKIDNQLVADNLSAMDDAVASLEKISIPEIWANCLDVIEEHPKDNYISQIQKQIKRQNGDCLPVSVFKDTGIVSGNVPLGTAKNEKSFICNRIPDWNSEQCIQCNLCATVCPHAAIRPFLVDGGVAGDMKTLPAKGQKNLQYRLQVSPLDCTGCALCYDICPSKKKALTMVDVEPKKDQESKYWDFLLANQTKPTNFDRANAKLRDVQFQQPLFEFSGACAGCGETAYIKLLTQLFGSSMLIANATGCSSIYGCSNFTTPYATNDNGFGPTWGTSLLENNAEYGYGMQLGSEVLQTNLARRVDEIIQCSKYSQELRKCLGDWLEAFKQNKHYEQVAQLVINALVNEKDVHKELQELYDLRFLFAKRSQWIIGGDGWAYDIGYGGLDHVLSKNSDVNILILDNEGYANTGGQTSTASPIGSRLKFASGGHPYRKKDLASILIQREHVYVAQIALGANPEQTLKAIVEAEQYKGPSVIIAYSPCVLHGIVGNSSIIEEKKAVKSGYWPLFRYHPSSNNEESTFKLDSRKPNQEEYYAFVSGEYRFSSLQQVSKDHFEKVHLAGWEEVTKRFAKFKHLQDSINHIKKGDIYENM